jgi:hypothetical protein
MLRDILIPGTIPEILAFPHRARRLRGSRRFRNRRLTVRHRQAKSCGATDPQGILATLLVLGVAAIVTDGLAATLIARFAAWRFFGILSRRTRCRLKPVAE